MKGLAEVESIRKQLDSSEGGKEVLMTSEIENMEASFRNLEQVLDKHFQVAIHPDDYNVWILSSSSFSSFPYFEGILTFFSFLFGSVFPGKIEANPP